MGSVTYDNEDVWLVVFREVEPHVGTAATGGEGSFMLQVVREGGARASRQSLHDPMPQGSRVKVWEKSRDLGSNYQAEMRLGENTSVCAYSVYFTVLHSFLKACFKCSYN